AAFTANDPGFAHILRRDTPEIQHVVGVVVADIPEVVHCHIAAIVINDQTVHLVLLFVDVPAGQRIQQGGAYVVEVDGEDRGRACRQTGPSGVFNEQADLPLPDKDQPGSERADDVDFVS